MVLTYILETTVCLAAFYAVYALLLSRETFFRINRGYLLATLGLSLVIPLLPAWIQASQEPPFVAHTLEPVVIGIQDITTTFTATPETPWWLKAMLVVYWTGVVFLGVRLVLNLRAILRMYRRGTEAVVAGRPCIVSEDTMLPFSFFKWIFLPREHGLTATELDEILRHESAHSSAWHSLDVLLMEVVCVFLWPSPVIYLYRRSLRRVHEYLADAAVLTDTPLKQYGQLLIHQSVPGMQLALTNHFFHHQLKQRILMMTKDKSRHSAMIKYLALLPILLLTITLFAFRQSGGDEPRTETPEIMRVQDSIPQVYKVVDEMPRFPGCEGSGLESAKLYECSLQKLLEHVYSDLKYPEAAQKAKVEGRTIAQFIVRSDGKVSHAKIVRSIGHGTDEAVLSVINAMPVWRPGYHEGRAVNVEFNLPVSFKLAPEPQSKSKDEPVSEPDPDAVYQVVDRMPRWEGCDDAVLQQGKAYDECTLESLVSFIQEHLVYPKEAKNAAVEGRALVKFTIRTDGSVADAEIVKSLGYGTDESILNMLDQMPSWQPGIHNGKAVHVSMTLPVTFALPAGDKAIKNRSASGNIQLEVFPVPSGDKLNYNISLPAHTGELVLDLVNAQGQSLHQEVHMLSYNKDGAFSGSVELSDKLTPGNYVLRVIWNKESITKSVLVQ